MLRRILNTLTVLLAAVGLLAVTVDAQQNKGKQHTLRGKVTEVGKDRLTVDHGNIPGYMGAMTMPYMVDKVDVLSKVKKGDYIEATVYEQDYTLYDLKVVPELFDSKMPLPGVPTKK